MPRFNIIDWYSPSRNPHPDAVLNPDGPGYVVDLTPEQVLALTDTRDVMLLGVGAKGNDGPLPRILLDERGGRFRQR